MKLWKFYAFATVIIGLGCEQTFQQETSVTNQRGLCLEFQILRNTIPINELIAISERHYRYDASFRRAMQFMHSGKFAMFARRIERSKPYQSMLATFEKAGVNVTDIATIDSIIDCLLLPLSGAGGAYGSGNGNMVLAPDMKYEIINNVNVNVHNGREVITDDYAADDYDDYFEDDFDSKSAFNMHSRTFNSFAMDVWRAIPLEKFSTVASKEAKGNPEFNQFLKVVQNRIFQHEVIRAMHSRALTGIIKKFRSRGIDVLMLLQLIFKLFGKVPLDAANTC